jgi:hypothetical protein
MDYVFKLTEYPARYKTISSFQYPAGYPASQIWYPAGYPMDPKLFTCTNNKSQYGHSENNLHFYARVLELTFLNEKEN